MPELLKFEYLRILKSKMIWVMIAISAVLPVLAVIGVQLILVLMNGELSFSLTKGNERFISWFVISYFYERLPIFIALFTPLFIGRDYKDGFIRNKITAGHTRFQVFCSAVITQASVTVCLCVVYILSGIIALLLTGHLDLNHGEMIMRCLVLTLSLTATSVLFAVISLLIKSRAGTVVICAAFIFVSSTAAPAVTTFSYNHKMIDQYEEVYTDQLDLFNESEFNKKDFFNAGWYILHPVYEVTNAGLGPEFVKTTSSFSLMEMDNLFEYNEKIARTGFVNQIYTIVTNNYGSFLLTEKDLKKIDGAYVKSSVAGAEYTVKSLVWMAVYFGGGYCLFRKKNLF